MIFKTFSLIFWEILRTSQSFHPFLYKIFKYLFQVSSIFPGNDLKFSWSLHEVISKHFLIHSYFFKSYPEFPRNFFNILSVLSNKLLIPNIFFLIFLLIRKIFIKFAKRLNSVFFLTLPQLLDSLLKTTSSFFSSFKKFFHNFILRTSSKIGLKYFQTLYYKITYFEIFP